MRLKAIISANTEHQQLINMYREETEPPIVLQLYMPYPYIKLDSLVFCIGCNIMSEREEHGRQKLR